MRVVVTGLGVISPLGCSVERFWKGLINGVSGVGHIESFSTEALPVRIAAEASQFDPLQFFSRNETRRMDRFSQIGVGAAQMAMEDSGLDISHCANKNMGVFIGTGIGGIRSYENAYERYYHDGKNRKIEPHTIPRVMNNAPASHIAIRFGLKDVNYTFNSACAAGANAIGTAFEYIKNNKTNLMLCGGVEAPITPLIILAWSSLRVLSRHRGSPNEASRPFDRRRDGFVLGEGAGMLVLESLKSADARGARIYAEIEGFGSNCHSIHLTAPSIKGEIGAIQSALKSADIQPEGIDYINAHGTGTILNDRVETMAIKKVFGDYACLLPVSSIKSMIGHSMGSSSALGIISTILTVKEDIIPPTINCRMPDPDCDLDYVPGCSRSSIVNRAISNSFAFGGNNSVLVVKKWKA